MDGRERPSQASVRSAKAGGKPRLHALELPIAGGALLVPSACVAEVMAMPPLAGLPGAEDWVLGVMNWRNRPVPVVAFERFGKGPEGAEPARPRVAVFYPLAGRDPWEYFALRLAAEPRPQPVYATTPAAPLPPRPGLAAAVLMGGRVLAIPDFSYLRARFYPAARKG